MIPTVSPKLLMLAHQKVAEDHEAGLSSDPSVSAVVALSGKCSPDQMIAICHRLRALAHLIIAGDGKSWTISAEGREYVLVSGDLFKAAAIAPLLEPKMVLDLRFGPEILDIALRDAKPEGTA
ncbi:hypothetical protein [Cereibacter azotoformans]|uniref:hypothetical protein n=1 Tax=Cereibacter azotoformans TaxID=43057 RepID=UPI000C6E15C3|nr:hypothetical protein [Cereibacter azotoformans]